MTVNKNDNHNHNASPRARNHKQHQPQTQPPNRKMRSNKLLMLTLVNKLFKRVPGRVGPVLPDPTGAPTTPDDVLDALDILKFTLEQMYKNVDKTESFSQVSL